MKFLLRVCRCSPLVGIALGRRGECKTLGGGPQDAGNSIAIILFLLFVGVTLAIGFWAARRTTTSSEFLTAGGKLSGFQNGTAIAGDFMSAASFLGITGLMFSGGFDGLLLAIGVFAAWPLLLVLLAERVRNLGRLSFADAVSLRLSPRPVRLLLSISAIAVVMLYLIGQMVGAGKLIELLFGIPYVTALITISVLVLGYVTLGGMLATSWVQIVKAAILTLGATILAVLVLNHVDFSPSRLLQGAANVHPDGARIFGPGILFKDPIQVATIMVSLAFGVIGLPHILIRLFTVENRRAARRSVFVASLYMGYFYLLMPIIGFGAILLLRENPNFIQNGELIGGGNMAAIHLAKALGGDALMGFMAAVSFATILAVVAGLTVAGAATVSHDLYGQMIRRGQGNPRTELLLARFSTVAIGMVAVGLGVLFEKQNIAFITALPMVVAASVNFPILFLSLFWPGLTTRGAVAGASIGLLSSIALIVAGPQVWTSILGFSKPLFPYDYPALLTMPLAFGAAWLGSVTDRSARGAIDREGYQRLLVQAERDEMPGKAKGTHAG